MDFTSLLPYLSGLLGTGRGMNAGATAPPLLPPQPPSIPPAAQGPAYGPPQMMGRPPPPPDVGDSLNPQPAKLPTPGYYGGSPATNPNLKPVDSAAPATPAGSGLVNALKGVTVPKPPDPQKVSTPAAARPGTAIKTGELLQLMQLLGGGGGGSAAANSYQLPSTLGAALGGRR